MKNPLVSIVIPTYNRAGIIKRTLDSVISQTYKNWQLIIVDDGSTDDTEDVIDKIKGNLPVLYGKTPENNGPSVARNLGMTKATGEYSTFLDSDDCWHKDFLQRMVYHLNIKKNVGLVYCDSKLYDDKGNNYHTFTFNPYNFKELLRSEGKIPTGSFMFRTELWDKVDGFREDMIRAEDFEWQIRLGAITLFDRVPECLHHYYRSKTGLISSGGGKNLDEIKKNLRILQNTKQEVRHQIYGGNI